MAIVFRRKNPHKAKPFLDDGAGSPINSPVHCAPLKGTQPD